MGILDAAAQVTSGEILWQPQADVYNLLKTAESRLRRLRGKELSMIFQTPRTALNPIRKVGKQIVDVLRCHAELSHTQLKPRALDLLASVKIPDPEETLQSLPLRAFRGALSARHDCPSAGLLPSAFDCRRADDGARCHNAGCGDDPAQRTHDKATDGDDCESRTI